MLMPNPEYQTWNKVDWIARRPKGQVKQHTSDWDGIYLYKVPEEKLRIKPRDPIIIHRGNITYEKNGTAQEIPFYTARHPKAWLTAEEMTPSVRKGPVSVPNLRSPARVVSYPRIREVETVMDLAAFRPPPFCSSKDIPSFSYTSSQMQRGRKLLRFLAAGAFPAGAITGGITGGGVAATVIEPLKAEMFHIQQVNAHAAGALAVISNSLDGMHNLINLIRTEEPMFKEQTKEELGEMRSAQSTDYFFTLCHMYRSRAMNLETELQTLFSTGLGRRTKDFQTILNPEFENDCSGGLCQLHL